MSQTYQSRRTSCGKVEGNQVIVLDSKKSCQNVDCKTRGAAVEHLNFLFFFCERTTSEARTAERETRLRSHDTCLTRFFENPNTQLLAIQLIKRMGESMLVLANDISVGIISELQKGMCFGC